MKHPNITSKLPQLAAGAGLVGAILRRMLYATGMDASGLLKGDHPLETALWLLTAGVLAFLVWAVWGLDGDPAYGHNFAPSSTALTGHAIFAAEILLTVLSREPETPGTLGAAWTVLGYASAPCLLVAGLNRRKGKQPGFGLHLIPCLFLMMHIVCHYRSWNSAPQLQSYGFAMFGVIALMFFLFYLTAFDVDLGRRRMLLFFGLTAMYLCLVEMIRTEELGLYLGGVLFCATNLCALTPVPKPLENKDGDKPQAGGGGKPC